MFEERLKRLENKLNTREKNREEQAKTQNSAYKRFLKNQSGRSVNVKPTPSSGDSYAKRASPSYLDSSSKKNFFFNNFTLAKTSKFETQMTPVAARKATHTEDQFYPKQDKIRKSLKSRKSASSRNFFPTEKIQNFSKFDHESILQNSKKKALKILNSGAKKGFTFGRDKFPESSKSIKSKQKKGMSLEHRHSMRLLGNSQNDKQFKRAIQKGQTAFLRRSHLDNLSRISKGPNFEKFAMKTEILGSSIQRKNALRQSVNSNRSIGKAQREIGISTPQSRRPTNRFLAAEYDKRTEKSEKRVERRNSIYSYDGNVFSFLEKIALGDYSPSIHSPGFGKYISQCRKQIAICDDVKHFMREHGLKSEQNLKKLRLKRNFRSKAIFEISLNSLRTEDTITRLGRNSDPLRRLHPRECLRLQNLSSFSFRFQQNGRKTQNANK